MDWKENFTKENKDVLNEMITSLKDKLEKKYEQLVEKVRAQKVLMIDKEEGKTTALGTSKINYIDPRISVAWCLKYEVPIDKIFNGTLREKFRWAIESVDEDWVS